jgi:hypothetical protein
MSCQVVQRSFWRSCIEKKNDSCPTVGQGNQRVWFYGTHFKTRKRLKLLLRQRSRYIQCGFWQAVHNQCQPEWFVELYCSQRKCLNLQPSRRCPRIERAAGRKDKWSINKYDGLWVAVFSLSLSLLFSFLKTPCFLSWKSIRCHNI